MGCVLVKVCDPPLPDTAIRDFWHIDGVIIDGYSSDSKNGGLYTKAVSGRMRTDSSSLDVASATAAFNSPSHTDMSGEEKQKNTGNSNGIAAQKRAFVHRRPAGILYVYNGRLVYKSRRCAFLSRNTKQLDVEICDINDVKALDNFTSNKDNRVYPGQIVDINVDNKNSMPFHLGFLTKQAEEVSRQLGETCLRHRQKPKIFQFNSVDVDGVEIDLP